MGMTAHQLMGSNRWVVSWWAFKPWVPDHLAGCQAHAPLELAKKELAKKLKVFDEQVARQLLKI